MPEFRRDPIIGQWVIVHTDDSVAPKDFGITSWPPRGVATCSFCPGKEHFTPPEVDAIREPGTAENKPGWKVRVVSNKFPALKIEGGIDPRRLGMYDLSNGVGAHEVVIDTTEHFKDIPQLSDDDVENIIRKYRSRVNDLTGDKRFKYITIFRNYGEAAGASVEHPHSQIVALPMIPKYVHEELEGAKAYFLKHHRCVFCDILRQEETEKKERVVSENAQFISFCPFVSRYPFECWIMPKAHHSDFATLADSEQADLAKVLKDVLRRIKANFPAASYNYYLHISPINSGDEAVWKESFHWHIEIVPQLMQMSGFEWGTGFYVVRTSPEAAAEFLRKS
jgi:UDPglucose--hexose-1-phosphate uridylyltransferase